MQEVDNLVELLKTGAVTPEQALEAFEMPAVHVKDIKVTLEVEVIPSGFRDLDRYQLLKKGRSEMIVLGARPSMGKSALMFQIGYNLAQQGEGAVLIYSLEMDRESIKRRLLASIMKRSIRKLKEGVSEYARAEKVLATVPLYIDDRAGLDVSTIRGSAVDFHRRRPISLVVVDYLQLVRSRALGNRNNEIGEVTAGLKAMAKDLKCPVLVGCQLNRECEKRGRDPRSGTYGDFRPILSDLRDSGNIEQDADIVAFLSRHERYLEGERPGEADIRIAKNRNGEVGDFTLKYSGEQTRFYDDDRPI